MPRLRLLWLAAVIALLTGASAWAQQPPKMSADLTRDVRDAKVQEQLIALGVLDATAGRASTGELSEAVAWFRKAYQSNRGMAGLSDDEKEILKQAKAKFDVATGLEVAVYRSRNPKTTTDIALLVPRKLVPETPQAFKDDASGGELQEYRSGKVAIGPVVHLLSDFTPIALFRESVMQVALTYKHLHLTSDEFAAVGEADDPDGGFISANMVLTSKDKLKGVFIRYPKVPPESFELPDFLVPVIATEPSQPDRERTDTKARGWQLLMQGVANLVMSEFPRRNGWQPISTQPCPLHDQSSERTKGVRVVFGTDRKAKGSLDELNGHVADAASLFANEPSNQLHLGCAYVIPPIKDATGARVLGDSKITQFRLLHSTSAGDIGDQLYLTDEIAESARTTTRALGKPVRQRAYRPRTNSGQSVSSALVFIHGYNVAFQDALFTIAQLKADTDYPGRVYMYSWPSAASTLGYIADMDQAEQAEPFLQSFMRLLMRDADIDAIDVIVHSMGSQSTLRALSALRSVFETQRIGETRQQTIRIGQIMFAAPDVAMPVFDQKIRRIAPYADRVTVYASTTDAALLASKVLRSGASRMGQLGDNGQPLLVEIKNVHVIDATGPERWWRLDRIMQGYGHDYFRQNAGVLNDIQRILSSIGKDDALTPKERSPTEFDEVLFENSRWPFWRLKETETQSARTK
jgi:esterase/lipase superfamily enzyme